VIGKGLLLSAQREHFNNNTAEHKAKQIPEMKSAQSACMGLKNETIQKLYSGSHAAKCRRLLQGSYKNIDREDQGMSRDSE
jgi:hypothetical protein